MRIGHYAPQIGLNGGVATYIRRTGRAQARRGHEVEYFGRAYEGDSGPSGFDYRRVADAHALFSRAEALNLDVLHLHRAVDELPDARVPTVRTVHGHQGGCPSASRYLSRTGEPCDRAYSIAGCLWGHFVDRCGSVRPKQLTQDFTRIQREIHQAEQIPTYTVSTFLKDQMRRAGCQADGLRTIHSPAPEVKHSFRPVSREDPVRFLFLGRLVPEKGLDWLFRAVPNVEEQIHVEVAGSGRQRGELERLASDLGIRRQVTFHGWVDSDRVPSLMQNARAVVFPSVWHEPAGLTSLEAAAVGRPLIASHVGGIPEYTNEHHAILVDVRDRDGLARAMDELASDPDRADRMGRRGRVVAKGGYSMAQFLDRLHDFYERA